MKHLIALMVITATLVACTNEEAAEAVETTVDTTAVDSAAVVEEEILDEQEAVEASAE